MWDYEGCENSVSIDCLRCWCVACHDNALYSSNTDWFKSCLKPEGE